MADKMKDSKKRPVTKGDDVEGHGLGRREGEGLVGRRDGEGAVGRRGGEGLTGRRIAGDDDDVEGHAFRSGSGRGE